MDNHEGPEAYSQTGTSYPLPDLWRGSGKRCANSVREPRKEPHRDRRLIAADSLTLPWRLTGLYR
jgi:hypothetical protein